MFVISVSHIIPIVIRLKRGTPSSEFKVVTPVPVEVISALKKQGKQSVTSALKFSYGLQVMNIEECPLRLITKASHKEKIKTVREHSENGQLGKLIWEKLSREPYFQRRSEDRFWIDIVIQEVRQETETEEGMEVDSDDACGEPRVQLPGRIKYTLPLATRKIHLGVETRLWMTCAQPDPASDGQMINSHGHVSS